MIALQILILLLGIYIVFCFLPSLVMFQTVFHHRTEGEEGRQKAYYIPYAALRSEAKHKLAALPCSELSLQTADGVTLKANYYDRGSDTAVIVGHGYSSTPLGNCAYQASLFADEGYNLLNIYQRAHGKSGGKYSSLGLCEQFDLLAWIELISHMPHIQNIVLYGVSMGAAAIAYASDKITDQKVRAMVLDCGFTGVYNQLSDDCKKWHVPTWSVFPVVCRLYRHKFGQNIKTSTVDSLKRAVIPTLVIHGEADDSVYLSHGKAICEALRGEKEALFVPNADHTCAMLEGGENAKKTLLSFVKKHINKESQT